VLSFLSRLAVLERDLGIGGVCVCLSVRPSSLALTQNYDRTITQISSLRCPGIFWFFETNLHPDTRETRLAMASNETGVGTKRRKRRFSTNKNRYLGNGRRPVYNDNGKLIGSRTWTFDWYQFRWPRTIVTHHFTLYTLCLKKRVPLLFFAITLGNVDRF